MTFKEYKELKRFRLREIAAELQVSESHLSAIMNGHVVASPELAWRINKWSKGKVYGKYENGRYVLI